MLFECPFCESENIKVIKTINSKHSIIRNRKCKTCGKCFDTIEIYKEITVELIENIIKSKLSK